MNNRTRRGKTFSQFRWKIPVLPVHIFSFGGALGLNTRLESSPLSDSISTRSGGGTVETVKEKQTAAQSV